MIRTQISLEEEALQALRDLARQRGVSIASLLREAVERLLEEAALDDVRARALAVSGRFSWPGHAARDHDAELADIFSRH